MRISVDPEDHGYNAAGIGAKVFLNGQPLTLCITADEEAGTAYCYKADANGFIDMGDDRAPKLETLRGKVRIDLSDCTLPVEFLDFDVWMRARTDRAHAEFMARTAAL